MSEGAVLGGLLGLPGGGAPPPPSGWTLLGRERTNLATHVDVPFASYTAHGLNNATPLPITDNVLLITHTGYLVQSATSSLRVRAFVQYTGQPGSSYVAAMHNGGDAFACGFATPGAGGLPDVIPIFEADVASPGIGVNYAPTLRVGQVGSAGPFSVNGYNGGQLYMDLCVSWLEVEEWQS